VLDETYPSRRRAAVRGHLENARASLELDEKRGGDPSWSATAREWIQHYEKVRDEPEAGTVN
jgi:hypothetical protein